MPAPFKWTSILALIALLLIPASRAGETKAEDMLPETTYLSLIIPDFSVAREAYGKTKLGEIYSKPEIQTFLMPIWAEMRKTHADLRAKLPLIPALEDLDTGLLSGELALGVYQRPNGIESPFGVLLTIKPKDPQALLRALPENVRQVLSAGKNMEDPEKPNNPSVALVNGRLIACFPGVDMDTMKTRAAGEKAPDGAKLLSATPAFTLAKSKLNNPAAWMFIAPDKINAWLMAMAGDEREWIPMVVSSKVLELRNAKAFAVGLNFNGSNPAVEGFLQLKGGAAPNGFYSLFMDKGPVSPDALKIAAADAPFVYAGHFNLAGIVPLIQEHAKGTPNGSVRVGEGLAKIQEFLGFDFQKDFLGNLGSECVIAQTALDTGLPLSFYPGMVATFPAKDPAKLEACLGKFGEKALLVSAALKNESKSTYEFLKYKKIDYQGTPIHYFSGAMLVLGNSFAVTVTNGRLLAGTTLNAVKRSIDQLKNPATILSNKDFQASVAQNTGAAFDEKALPVSFAYSTDKSSGTGTLALTLGSAGTCAGGLYGLTELTSMPEDRLVPPSERPSILMLIKLANAVDLGLWPDEGFFIPYRTPAFSFMRNDPDGISWRSDLPGPGPSLAGGMNPMLVSGGVAMVAAIAIPNLLRFRMAANEAAAIAACKTFCSAEDTYRRVDYNGDGVLEYAQSLKELNGDGKINLVDHALAAAEGGEENGATPKNGYYFKVLKGQGEGAPGGKKSYLDKNNRMTIGYAILAYPAKYDSTGRNCFIINSAGTIYQRDLGPETPTLAKEMTGFDPSAPNGEWIPAE